MTGYQVNTERVGISLSEAEALYYNEYQRNTYICHVHSSALSTTSAFGFLAAVIEFLAHLTTHPRVMLYLMSMVVLVDDPVLRGTGVVLYS